MSETIADILYKPFTTALSPMAGLFRSTDLRCAQDLPTYRTCTLSRRLNPR